MNVKKPWIESINNRISRRSYIEEDLGEKEMKPLLDLINEINTETNLNIQFIKDCKDGLSGFKASYGMISGAKSFVALVGSKNIENYKQKLGYYGEMIVLEATAIGLGTCWVGGTYKRQECEKQIEIGIEEELACIVVIGHTSKELSIKEKVVAKLNKKNRSFDDVLISKNKDMPYWVEKGIEAVMKAPSALNKNPVAYKLENEKVKAIITKNNHGYEEIDLGISMLHFTIGAYSEGYEGSWKNQNGEYIFY